MRTFDQTASPAELEEYRLQSLNASLLYAVTHSACYNAHFRGLELPLESLEAYAAFPTMSAEDVTKHGAALACIPQSEIARIVTLRTSGTTGASKRLFFTRGELENTVDFFRVGMAYLCAPGDRVAVFMPGLAPDGVGDLLRRGLERLGAIPAVFGPIDDEREAAKRLRDGAFQTVVGIPGQIRRLAICTPEPRPKNVLLSADYVPRSLKRLVAELWQTEVFEHYGMTETCYGGAVECPCHQGMHIRHDELYFEILDREGRPLPPGKTGEIAVSTLRRRAMPLFRYRTGDLGVMTDAPCDCGSRLPRLLRVCGRKAELARPVNIHALDELLLGDGRIEDFTAGLRGNALTVAVSGGEEALSAASETLRAAYPALSVTVRPGEPFATTGTLKRRLIVE